MTFLRHRSTPMRRRAPLLWMASALLVLTLVASAVSPLRPAQQSSALGGWNWYKVDTHVHSSVSADAFVDLGIHAQGAIDNGYDAIFATDHNGASSFQINNLTANHMAFDDSYTRWTTGSFGSLSSSTNVLAGAPVKSGSSSLHLQAAGSSTNYGETYVWTKRGPNFRSGDIVLNVAIYPTRIDPGSGAYVSVSIGGDPSVQPSPFGYTTAAGVVSPGKSIVLVWQIGTPRAPSSDPSARVIVNSLGSYTLNTWNQYTINVSQALATVGSANQPLDYDGLTDLKMAVGGGAQGAADAYFDSYTIDASAPANPADEYVYRTSVVDDFNTSTFKIFPAYEMGQQKHSNRFNFGITDPSQYVSYTYGSDGIVDTQQTGYPAQLNHPGITISTQEAIDSQGKGADFLEVRESAWVDVWDAILQQGAQIIGVWSTDTHTGLTVGKPATFIYAPTLDFDELVHSLYEGRAYVAPNNFGGRVAFNLDPSSLEPYPARYPVYVPEGQTSANVHLAVTGGISRAYTVRWVVNGTVYANDSPAGSSYDATKAIPLTGTRTYVRAEVVASSGAIRALTEPIVFINGAGLPAGTSIGVDRVATSDRRWYNVLYTKGITGASWSAVDESLTLSLANPAGALVSLLGTSDVAPMRVRVDGAEIVHATSQAQVDAATDSAWYYDTASKQIFLKVLQAGTIADVRLAFSAAMDTEAPSAPANLSAVAIDAERVGLSWDASIDNIGVAGYDIYRDGVLLSSAGPETTFTDASVAPLTSYVYTVRARDAAGNTSPPSSEATATTPIGLLFSDAFETGDLSRWSSNNGLVAQQADVYAGAWAARASSSGSATYATENLTTSQTEVYYRMRFKVLNQGASTVYLGRLRTSSGSSILGLYLSVTGRLGYRNDVAGASTTSATVVSPDAWHVVQVQTSIAGPNSQTQVWLDGALVPSLTRTHNLGTAPIGRIQLGENSSGRTYDIVFDDVGVDAAFIADSGGGSGDTTPPDTVIDSAPPALTNAASASISFHATEAGSSFACRLDGAAFTACASPATYTGLAGGSHSFAVRATDPAGNADTSPATAVWTIDLTPPGVPAGLTAHAQSGNMVNLGWTASSDNIAVGGYEIYRDGVLLAAVGATDTSYADGTTTPGGTYGYTVVAIDTAGNRSAPSDPINVTTPATSALTLTPVADSYVNAASPNSKYGYSPQIRVDASPDVRSYLRFDVQGVSGTPTRVLLRVYANSGSSSGVAAQAVADNTWTERGISSTNAPPAGATLASAAQVAAGTWIELDITGVVTGNGLLSFALSTPGSTAISMASRESGSSTAPQLVIELGP